MKVALVFWACGLLLAPAASPAAVADRESHFIDASLDIDGELLSWRFVDVDLDGKDELVMGVRTQAGERELLVHRLREDGLEREPTWRVPILTDVLAWGCADVRAEAGRELILLTRGGAWSYSLHKPGYRDNARILVREELVYDLPDPRSLPYWAFTLPSAGQPGAPELVLLPARDGFGIYGPASDSDQAGDSGAAFERRAFFPANRGARVLDDEEEDEDEGNGGEGAEVLFGGSTPFLPDGDRAGGALLSTAWSYRAPALIDYDGDGLLDIVLARDGQLAIHLGDGDGPSAEVSRVETMPEVWEKGDLEVEMRLLDLDGDGKRDLLVHLKEEADGLEDSVQRLLVYHQRAGKLIRDKPDQVLRFEAAYVVIDVADVDGDGRPDLVIRKLEMPSLLDAVTGLTFEFTHLVHLGGKGRFERKPVLESRESYDEDDIVELAANRELVLDCNDDGIADLVEIDLKGDVIVRRLQKHSGFLRGTRWELDAAAWKRFPADGSIESLTVQDFNGDGLGDVVSAGDHRLSILLSSRGGKR